MRKLILAAGAAFLALSMPAAAEAQGKGKGNGAKAHHSMAVKAKGGGVHARSQTQVRARSGARLDRRHDRNANGIPDYRERRLADIDRDGIPDYRERRIVDLDRDGIPDYRERFIDRDRDGIDDRSEGRSGAAACPPGLAKKTPACIPPGQARQAFSVGARLPAGYRFVPVPADYIDDLERMGGYDPDRYRYYYDRERVYVVDPRTRLIERIVDLVL